MKINKKIIIYLIIIISFLFFLYFLGDSNKTELYKYFIKNCLSLPYLPCLEPPNIDNSNLGTLLFLQVNLLLANFL